MLALSRGGAVRAFRPKNGSSDRLLDRLHSSSPPNHHASAGCAAPISKPQPLERQCLHPGTARATRLSVLGQVSSRLLIHALLRADEPVDRLQGNAQFRVFIDGANADLLGCPALLDPRNQGLSEVWMPDRLSRVRAWREAPHNQGYVNKVIRNRSISIKRSVASIWEGIRHSTSADVRHVVETANDLFTVQLRL